MQCEERRKVLRFNHKPQRHPKCPFRRDSHVSKDTEVVVEDAELPTNLLIKKGRQTQSQGIGQCDNKPYCQQFGISYANTRFRFTKQTPIHKNSIPGNKNTPGSSSRKTKILFKVLEKINQRPKRIGHYTTVSDTLLKKPSQKSKSLTDIGMSKDQKILVGQEISNMLKKWATRECQPHPNQFLSTLFLVGKKDGAIVL